MLCISPLTDATAKYDLNPYVLLSWINRDNINGSHIDNNWNADENIIWEYIAKHHLMFNSDFLLLTY